MATIIEMFHRPFHAPNEAEPPPAALRDRGRGRVADEPSEIPPKGWRDILLRVKDAMTRDRLSIVAAGVAFYGMLAVFPAIGVLMSLYGLFFDPQQVYAQLSTFGGVLPGQALDFLLEQLKEIASQPALTLSTTAIGAL